MKSSDKEELLAKGAIVPTMLKLGIPTFVAQLIFLLYNVVDRIYIGHIPGQGSAALTGLGICFPILSLVTAFASFVGAGGSPLAGIALGKGDKEEAEKILANGLIMLVGFAVILTVVFQIIKKPFLYMFGASDVTYPYAGAYLSIYLCGTIFVLLALGLNTFIIVQGQSTIAMISVLLGAILNIVLDPIMIFIMGLGVRGAAFATIISQAVSAIWILKFLLSKKATIRIRKSKLFVDLKVMRNITALGISPFIMSATESVITIAFNTGAQKYGNDLYVGSITILQSVLQMIFVPLNGFTQGCQPLISYNYGAQNIKRVKKTSYILLGITFTFSFVLSGLSIIFPGEIASIFTDSKELIVLCDKVLPIYIFGMLAFGLQTGSQTTFMALGKAKQAFFFAVFRKIILLTPLVIILPKVMDSVMGIYYAEPISDAISAICCFIVCIRTLSSLNQGEEIRKSL